MNELLVCQNLTKSYGPVIALNNLNLVLGRGRIVGLLGPNGSGKTTLIKLINNLLVPSSGNLYINGYKPGVETKSVVSYLPERLYLGNWMTVQDALYFFQDFYSDFDLARALDMLQRLAITPNAKMNALSKGTKEKVQLILVMSRRAQLYCLDEPIAGVDPAARDYILSTIINNYEPNATILLSTHLINDVESILDEVIFLRQGQLILQDSVDSLRASQGKSIDTLFREVFRC